MEWLKRKKRIICSKSLSSFILFITRSAVGIGNVASVEGGDDDKFVILLDEEEVVALLDIVVLVAIRFLSGR